MDRGAWWAAVLGVAESDMALKQLSTHAGGIHRGPGRGQEVASGWRHQGC